tara:strand:- start:55035 stop:55304 length:270 start_codon:yes stop_codon:yes gene_type:complete
MPKKRRKLNKDMEKSIASAKQTVELITAKINDIDEEDIQVEYRQAFQPAVLESTTLAEYYKTSGFTEESDEMLINFNKYLKSFLDEYEL